MGKKLPNKQKRRIDTLQTHITNSDLLKRDDPPPNMFNMQSTSVLPGCPGYDT